MSLQEVMDHVLSMKALYNSSYEEYGFSNDTENRNEDIVAKTVAVTSNSNNTHNVEMNRGIHAGYLFIVLESMVLIQLV